MHNLKKFLNVKITFKAEKSQFIVFLKIEFFISIINNSEIEVFNLKTSEFKNFKFKVFKFKNFIVI